MSFGIQFNLITSSASLANLDKVCLQLVKTKIHTCVIRILWRYLRMMARDIVQYTQYRGCNLLRSKVIWLQAGTGAFWPLTLIYALRSYKHINLRLYYPQR